MNVLTTGHLGYIGSVLTPILNERGYTTVGLDTAYFEDCLISQNAVKPAREIRKDIREVGVEDLEGIDAVIHLAAISNDPMGQLNPGLTDQVNHLASVELARKAKEAGVARFVFSSSCSMYGAADGKSMLTEEAPFNPVSAYALSKVQTEAGLQDLASADFSPVYLRNATAYGLSPRLRFDLVLNNLVGWALATEKIRIMSDGTPWRPMVHVEDICGACIAVLEASREAIHNQAFNVGRDSENFQVRDIAEVVRQTVPGCEVEFTGENQGDSRSYQVSFQKVAEQLTGFRPRWTLQAGADELYRFLQNVNLTLQMFQDRRFTRLAQFKHLMETGQLDAYMFWSIANGGEGK